MKISILSKLLITFFTITLSSVCFADSVMKAEFENLDECLKEIKMNTGLTLKIIRDKPSIVTGNLSNGKTFACERKESGTKGVYYEGWYMVDDK
ncbi:hypothetical protein [Limnobaculum xujianqingii]|uniref:hypothetical protein n=1 Tax=Limnobaculum xujianqingii TaxID=2738837 RepID=UPI001E3A3C9D|nr:hypothetical protein [Limnobaculum xujianqingii]